MNPPCQNMNTPLNITFFVAYSFFYMADSVRYKVDSLYLVAYSFHFLADSFFITSPPCRIYESAIIINEYTTFLDECASVLCRGFIINGGGLLEKPALFIFWWRNSSLFLGLRPMLCCCVLLRQVWSCVALSSMSSGLILSCRVLCGLVLFCLRCFSTQTLCPELLSSISIWVVRMAQPRNTVPLDGGSTIAPINRSHLCHDFPYIDTCTHTLCPSSRPLHLL